MMTKGGKRKGAGKPALYGKAMKRINVMLDPETIAFYTEHGKGNLSEGIRQYWRSLTQRAADGVLLAQPQNDAQNEGDGLAAGNAGQGFVQS